LEADVTTPARGARQRGLSILEVTIALTLVVAVIALVQGGIVSIHSANQRGESQLSIERRARDVADRIAEDLKRCSLVPDPATGQPRFDFSERVDGRPVARFTTLEGTRIVGGEVVERWSTEIRYENRANGSVVRLQDGATLSVGEGIESIEYVASAADFVVTVVARGDDARGVRPSTATRTVRPLN